MFDAGLATVKKEHPELEDNLIKSFGFAMGIEFREASLLIAPKTKAPAKKGTVMVCRLFVCLLCVDAANLLQVIA